jgi:hypothetical protein
MRRFISFRGPFGMRLITTTVAIFAGYFLTVQYPYLHALDRKSYETREQCEEAAKAAPKYNIGEDGRPFDVGLICLRPRN